MLSASHNLLAARPGSTLAALRADWLARGWDLDALAGFRMDNDTGGSSGGAGGGDGGGGQGGGNGGGSGGSGGAGDQGAPVKEFTQDDLNRVAAREKEEGKRAAERAVAEQFGCSIDEAKKLIEAHREAEKGKMTEAERKLADAQEAERKAAGREAAASLAERRATLREKLADAGVKTDRRDGATKLILSDLADDADDTAITTAVDDCKKAYPEFFADAAGGGNGNGNRKPPSGDVTGTPPRKQGAEDPFAKRFEEAKGRYVKESA